MLDGESEEKIEVIPEHTGVKGGKCRVTPIPFCCYVTVPESFEPVRECDKPVIASAIVDNCTFLCEGPQKVEDVKVETACGAIYCDIEVMKTDLVGCIKIQNALKIKECRGCQYTYVCCCDCVCLCETLCYRCPECEPPCIDDVMIEIDKDKLNAVYIDECNGKSLYKITGALKVTLKCPKC